MEPAFHTLSNLFDQLGLASSDQAIDEFINKNKPLNNNLDLHQAHFWNDSQADFLREEKLEDADWAELIDQLDVMLRQ